MKNLLLLLCGIALILPAHAQYVYSIKADSVLLTGGSCDSSELIIKNHTQAVQGFLYNTGNGRTVFKKVLTKVSTATYLVGADTLTTTGSAPPVDTVDNIAQLENYSRYANVHTVIVSDTLRGGVFNWFPAGMPDSGQVFPATGIGSGFWIRNLGDKQSSNPWWYGLTPNIPGDTTGAHANAIALQRCVNANHIIQIPSGNYYIDSTIYLYQGTSIGGVHAQGGANANGGTALITTDTVTALAYALAGDINGMTLIHDMSLYNIAAWGVQPNDGLVISRGFYDVQRLIINNFSGSGLHVTSFFNGVNTVADNGNLTLVYSTGNGRHGVEISDGADNNNCNINQCQSTANHLSGFYLAGNHHVIINTNSTLNRQYAIDDEGSSNVYLNPYVEEGYGDTVMLNGVYGVFDAGAYFGGKFVIAGTGVGNGWSIDWGSRHASYGLIGCATNYTGSNPLYNLDTTFAYQSYLPGHMTYYSIENNTPQPEAIDISTVGGPMTNIPMMVNTGISLGGFLGFGGNFSLGTTGPWGQGIVWNCQNLNSPYITSEGSSGGHSVVITSPNLHNYPYDLSIGENGNIYGHAGVFLGGQTFQGLSDVGSSVISYAKPSNATTQREAGFMAFTNVDSISLQPRAHAFGVRNWVDTTGQWNFSTFGVDSATVFDQTHGGNYTFLAHDSSSQLIINTTNKSTYATILKTGPYLPGTTTDSILVWHRSDSSIRKVAATSPDTVWGNVSTSGTSVMLSLPAANVNVTFSYGTSTAETAALSAISGSATVNWTRSVLYGASGSASATGDAYTLSTSLSIIDASVYNQSNEQWKLNVMNPSTHAVYEVNAMLSNNGANTIVWAHRIF
ncbi:hypothetical protein [Dinghuibacter silviterrae]|uniref:Pectate lyase-like protein n=1 Tax=Dinghuibacter silviterrae TaxID=1539049 RepID=A0A4R8DI26_9BACT|nr:hypothetical protein [Dinghuibacter silviterrae]TDW97391.1 hypothetical protein EDB95_5239 [Dinghuibacter silviterrae]